MTLRRVSPKEAYRLLEQDGYIFLDVRSVPEFEAGHPTGAYNIPLLNLGSAGMEPNHDFLTVVERVFPMNTKLVIGCKAGGRSRRAAEMLLEHGYTDIIDQRAGFVGASDGSTIEPGWQPQGLPVSTEPEPGRSYDELVQR